MSRLTIEIDDEARDAVEQAAREQNLSASDYVRLAVAQALSRSLKDPVLEARAARADGGGFRDFLASVPDAPRIAGDQVVE
jgi:Arc/MetJ family transcription regulator